MTNVHGPDIEIWNCCYVCSHSAPEFRPSLKQVSSVSLHYCLENLNPTSNSLRIGALSVNVFYQFQTYKSSALTLWAFVASNEVAWPLIWCRNPTGVYPSLELSLFGLKLVEIHLICTQISHSRLNCVIWQSKRTLKDINHSLRLQVCSSYLLSFTRTCILPLEPGCCPSRATDTVKIEQEFILSEKFPYYGRILQ